METFIRIGQLLLSLSILVVLHEGGHFFAAKYFKTRVEKFYLFFNPWFSLFKKKVGETEYGIGWLPLGGYVKISGMIDESMDTEQMAQEPQPWEFRSKPAWQRLIIMLGGVIVNIITGFIIYAMILFSYGEQTLPVKNITDGLMINNEMAREIGFANGDKIISIGGNEDLMFGGLMEQLIFSKSALVERNGEQVTIEVPEDILGQLSDQNKSSFFFYPRFPFVIGEIPDSSHNATSGLMVNDSVVAINGVETKYFDQVSEQLKSHSGKTVSLEVIRKGVKEQIPVTVNDSGKIGIVTFRYGLTAMRKSNLYDFKTVEYGFLESFPAGWHKMTDKLTSYVKGFALIFKPSSGAYKGLSGFGGISKMFATHWDWEVFWNSTAFLSIILAFMNLLPIPALDGGHVMFLLYEMVTGRTPNEKFMEYAQLFGIILLLGLMLYANGNDIFKWWMNR